MKEIFKPVPNYDDLVINQDGTVIYYKGKQKNILINTHTKTNIKYKYVYIDCNCKIVSRLVYSAFIGEIPKYRKVFFKDGNSLNTNYKNLLPFYKKNLLSTEFKPVKGLSNVFINSTGTEVYQDNFSVNITTTKTRNKEYLTCPINTFNGCKSHFISHLVASAWLDWSGKGYILHSDNNTKNNYYKNIKILSKNQYKNYNGDLLKQRLKETGCYKPSKIPENDFELIRIRLLQGHTLRQIAKDYNTSDMAVNRIKQKLFNNGKTAI